MKQRFSSLDVKVISQELSKIIVGLRVTNIYDLSSRICLFKLAKPDVKQQLVVDAGFRCHLTDYARTTAEAPSPFISRLRKFLKTRRVTKVSQVGTDRIIDLEFSDGLYHLFLEFFAAGNIILTDNEYKIVALLRIVPEEGDQEEIKVGVQYLLEKKQNYGGIPPLTHERLKSALEKTENLLKQDKKGKKKRDHLRRAISLGFPEYPPLLVDHAFNVTGYDSTLTLEQALADSSAMEKLLDVLKEADRVASSLSGSEQTVGYILAEEIGGQPDKPARQMYDDFHPFLPKQLLELPGTKVLEYPTFNKAVDEYFSCVESQKLESRLTEREETARRKLENARKDHERRVGSLQQTQELQVRKAHAIEENLRKVEAAINAVNVLIAQGMDWMEIAKLIEMEQEKQNPVAKLIKLPLKLYENTITLLLSESDAKEDVETDDETDEESESEEEGPSLRKEQAVLSIDVDLALSPWANARQYYGQKKVAAVKEEKTLSASKKALESTQKKVNADLKQGLKQEKPVLRTTRTHFWFEKFLFFISSEGYLVIGGKDPQQSELIYQRHLNKGDIYVHSDLDRATPFVVKNNPQTPGTPIPPSTLSQAGMLSVCTSVAWDSKAVMGAWWVKAEQVSKTTETGEYLTTGGFIVRGEKKILPPAQLILGFGVIWLVSEGSASVMNWKRTRGVEDAEKTTDGHPEEAREDGDVNGENEITEDAEGEKETQKQIPSGETKEPEVEQMPMGDGSTDEVKKALDDKEPAVEQACPDKQQSEGKQVRFQASESESEDIQSNAESGTEDKEADVETSVQQLDLSDTKGKKQHQPSAKERRGGKHAAGQAPKAAAPKPNTSARGKRGKSKKAAQKYKDQDDEDRELALQLLGSAGSKSSKGGKHGAPAKSKAELQAEYEAQKQRRRAQHDKAARLEKERLARMQRAAAATGASAGPKDADQDADHEPEDLSMLPALVGTPVPGDDVLGALPMCGPWNALARCRFRTKVQPGPMKKGKAVQEMIGRWVAEAGVEVKAAEKEKGEKKQEEEKERREGVEKKGEGEGEDGASDEGNEGGDETKAGGEQNLAVQELEFLKGWRDVEVVNAVPVGSLRIVSGGGTVDKGKNKGNSKGKGGGGGGKGNAKPAKGAKGGKKK